MKHIRTFNLFEGLEDSIILKIKSDMDGLRMDGQPHQGDLVVGKDTVMVDFRDLGNWEHNEESHDEEDGDDWMEDDDQMVWASGEYKKYLTKFQDWAKNKTWFDKVKLDLQPSEKNWVSFVVTLKK